MAVGNMFLQYVDFLEYEQGIKEKIFAEVKVLDRVLWRINVLFDTVHDQVTDKRIKSVCDSVSMELDLAKEVYEKIKSVIPPLQFYKYASYIRSYSQSLVQATAFVGFLSTGTLITLEDVAKALNLKPADICNSQTTSRGASGLQENIASPSPLTLEKQIIRSVVTAKNPEVTVCVTDAEDGKEDLEETETVAKQPEGTLAGVSKEDSASCSYSGRGVSHLATCSITGTQLIITPATPTPSPDYSKCASARRSSTDDDDCAYTLDERKTETASPSVPTVPSSVDVSVQNSPVRSADASPTPTRPLLAMLGVDDRLLLDTEDYIHGCLMMTSDLARLAVNAAAAGNYSLPHTINKFLRQMFTACTLLNLKNNSLRKICDGVKYSLSKTEEVVYNLSLRGLRPATQ